VLAGDSIKSYGIPTIPESYYKWGYEENNGAIVAESYNTSTVPLELLRRKANATMVMLARNSDLDGVMRSVREAEDRFNRWHGYPWVFLNEEPFSDEFKRYDTLSLFLVILLTHLCCA
jgi:hypothetical protein